MDILFYKLLWMFFPLIAIVSCMVYSNRSILQNNNLASVPPTNINNFFPVPKNEWTTFVFAMFGPTFCLLNLSVLFFGKGEVKLIHSCFFTAFDWSSISLKQLLLFVHVFFICYPILFKIFVCTTYACHTKFNFLGSTKCWTTIFVFMMPWILWISKMLA